MAGFIFWGSKITSDSDFNHEIKRCLLLGRQAMKNLDKTAKNWDITLPTGPYSQSYVSYSSRVWIWELDYKEGWAPKNWCFKLCWRRLLRVPWTTRRLNLSILNRVNLEYSLEGLMLKLKLQYFGHFMWRTDSLEKTLMLWKIECRRRRGRGTKDKTVG